MKYGRYYHEIQEGREEEVPVAGTSNEKTASKDSASSTKQATRPSTAQSNQQNSNPTTSRAEEKADVKNKAPSVVPISIPTNTHDTLILGDSNLKNIENTPRIFIQAESGATFLSVTSLVGVASKQTDTSDIKMVVLHLGTNDVTRHEGGEIMLNANRAITAIEKKFPEADIAICSIPPRKGREREQSSANDVTLAVNSYMQALCRRSNNLLYYIDTYTLLAPKGRLAKHLFSKTDPSGVHFSRTGKSEVISRIVTTLGAREEYLRN